ncbi:YciI family protein [Kordiimonas aquimaris]|uniref:YciI family protein n=1 Tax=Kordiimonas aquimaris TaxID=707591 RepID=UPI0021D06F18|nr:YciI family protein [Kordiimonas aquimaris]
MNNELLEAHVKYLHILSEAGHLRFCGPCLDDSAVMILSANDMDAVRGLVENDPFSGVNYYAERKVIEVQEATPGNDFLLGWSQDKMAITATPSN